ncbi:hypothetical protein O3M35_007692 [Rhynocoris fuscipes]|uniref:Reverse transcriptase zinc-binding domain-containing protein n=1 Tax=Rhynocoris fuscipes TaxID=488301 RepID=A0AAW1DCU5_9HEMI
MYNRRIADDDLCRFCLEEDETAVHVLCHCEGLVRLRLRIMRKTYPRHAASWRNRYLD